MSYGEERSEAETLVDAHVKARVLRGIELLKEKWGPDFADHINPDTLMLSSCSRCVLGQLYADAKPTEEQWQALYGSGWAENRWLPDDNSGYVSGLAILDGALTASPTGPIEHGFDAGYLPEDDRNISHEELDDVWRAELAELRS